jgi:hypothetical protein
MTKKITGGDGFLGWFTRTPAPEEKSTDVKPTDVKSTSDNSSSTQDKLDQVVSSQKV